MAGALYHYATPIGAGMTNLANAISSIPKRDAEAGLLAARQKLLDAQVDTEAAQQSNLYAQQRMHAATADDTETKTYGRRTAADAFRLRGSSTGLNSPPADAPPPLQSGASVRSLLGSLQGGGVSGVADALTSPVAPAVVPGVGVVPGAGGTPGMASAILPGAGTGVNPSMVAELARGGTLAGEKVEDMLRMFSGGNLASIATKPDVAMSNVMLGAGDPFQHTPRGVHEALTSTQGIHAADTAQRAAEAAQNSRDRLKIEADKLALEEQLGNKRITAENTRAANKLALSPRAKGAMLTKAQEDQMRNDVTDALTQAGIKPQTKDVDLALKAARARWLAGEDYVSATEGVIKDIVEPTPGTEGSRWFGLRAPAPVMRFKPPAVPDEALMRAGAEALPAVAPVVRDPKLPDLPRDPAKRVPGLYNTPIGPKRVILDANGKPQVVD